MKKRNLFWAVLFAFANFLIMSVGCDDVPTTEACLTNGDPNCGPSGSCLSDPSYNHTCPLPDGTTGHYTCDAQGGLVCVSGPPGDCSHDPNLGHTCKLPDGGTGEFVCTSNGVMCSGGGTGGEGGGPPGPYNCHLDPNNGEKCKTPQGQDGKWGCNPNGTALYCFPNGGGGTGGDGGGGGHPPYNCHDDPGLYAPCTTSDGHIGVEVCNELGTGLTCKCTDTNCGGGGGGDGGGGGVYNCAIDSQLGHACQMGYGICMRNGIKVCNMAGDGLMCNATAGPPNPSGEICGNGLDDDCDGAVDELPCTTGGGDGGGGGTGDGGGGGGTGGGATCTTVTSANTMVTGSSFLTSLLKGDASISSSNPLNLPNFANQQLLSLAAGNGLSVTTSTVGAQMNVWAPHTGGGGDPMPLFDALFCRQLGFDPSNPAECSAGVIGDRKSAAYLSGFRIDWECWRKGAAFCPSSINGHMPGDAFALVKIVANGDGDSESFNGSSKWRLLEMPPKCP